jgi:hypothetical protein
VHLILGTQFRLLPSAIPADNAEVEKLVAVVICLVIAAPAGGANGARGGGELLRAASLRSGLSVRHGVPERTLRGARYDQVLQRAFARDYPSALQQLDATLYSELGLTGRTDSPSLSPQTGVWYDPTARSLLHRSATTPKRARVINELARALVDQHFNLQRLTGLRSRDRDRALAAAGIVDGTAALVSGLAAKPGGGTPLARFLQLDSGLSSGRSLAKELRYIGGTRGLATALRTFPQTTEQLMHVDKFLERERSLPLRLPNQIGEAKLQASETFGELDVRSLLGAFRVANASAAAAGWGGGRIALYVSAGSETTTLLVLRWDSYEDAVEWRKASERYVAAAFAGVAARDCPPLDHCWSGPATLGAATIGQTSVFASGPDAAAVAAAALAGN